VRGMVGQGFGFSLLVTKPYEDRTYDGKRLVCRPIKENVSGSQLVATWLRKSQLTKPVRLFVDHCKMVLSEIDTEHALPSKVTDIASIRRAA